MDLKRWISICGPLLALGCGGDGAGDDDSSTTATGSSDTPADAIDLMADSYLPSDYLPTDPQRVIFMGDSITGGVGATSSSLTYPR